MSSTRSFLKYFNRSGLGSLNRIIIHSTYVLGSKALPIYAVSALFTVLFGLAVIYRVYYFISSFLTIFIVLVEILIVGVGSSVIDELREGTIQVYLASGLSRTEYIWSWILAVVIYPSIAIPLSIIIPVIIINPDILFTEIRRYGITISPYMHMYVYALTIQLLLHMTWSIGIGIVKKNKSLAWLTVILLTIVIPLVSSIVTAFMSFVSSPYYMGRFTYSRTLSLIYAPYSPLLSISVLQGDDPLYDQYVFLSLSIPSIIAFVSIVLFTYYVKKYLEV